MNRSTYLNKHYERYYKSYDPINDVKDYWQWCLSVFPKFDKALEIPCRTGRNIRVAKEMDLFIYGIDNADLKHVWEKHGIDGQCRRMDARKLEFEDDAFDYVYSIDFLQHFRLFDINKILNEIYRVGSCLFLFRIDTKHRNPTNITFNSIGWWMDRLHDVGFIIEIMHQYSDFIHVEATK